MNNATIDLDDQGFNNTAIDIDASAVLPKPTITLRLIGTNTITGSHTFDRGIETTSANLALAGTGSLNINDAKGFYGIHVDGTFTASAASVTIIGCDYGIECTGDFVLSGSSIAVSNPQYRGVKSDSYVNLKSGSLSVGSSSMYGISGDRGVILSGANVTIGNTKSYGIQSSNGSIEAKSGTVLLNTCDGGFSCESAAFTLSGANVTVHSPQHNGVYAKNVVVKSGSLAVNDCQYGLYSMDTIVMSGGKLAITGAKSSAILSMTQVKITGGAVTATNTGTASFAIEAWRGMSNKPSCLKSIKGALATGATFKAGGSTYSVTNGSYSYGKVTLKQYGAKSKKPSVNTAAYGGVSYQVAGIAAKAFATKKGKAITALTLGSNVESIGKNAFAGTSKMKTLNIKEFYYYINTQKMNKKAFAKCGKGGGKGLTVLCARAYDRTQARKILVQKGLSKKAKFK